MIQVTRQHSIFLRLCCTFQSTWCSKEALVFV